MAAQQEGGGNVSQERDGYCSGDLEDPDCRTFHEFVDVFEKPWPGGRLGVGVPGVWIASVEMYIDRYVASDTCFGEPRMTSDVMIGLLAPPIRGNLWVSRNSPQTLAVLQEVARRSEPWVGLGRDYWVGLALVGGPFALLEISGYGTRWDVTVDPPHGNLDPHLHYGPYLPGGKHPRYHFGPKNPNFGRGRFNWLDWLRRGGPWRWR